MRSRIAVAVGCFVTLACVAKQQAITVTPQSTPDTANAARALAAANAAYLAALPENPVRILVSRLDLEKYKATI